MTAKDEKAARLAAALRENLLRRKRQARGADDSAAQARTRPADEPTPE